MKRAIVVAVLLVLAACGGGDPKAPPANSTQMVSATSREWVQTLTGARISEGLNFVTAGEPDDNWSVEAAVVDSSDGAAAGSKQAHLSKEGWGVMLSLDAPPSYTDESQWVTYQITATGLRNGG